MELHTLRPFKAIYRIIKVKFSFPGRPLQFVMHAGQLINQCPGII